MWPPNFHLISNFNIANSPLSVSQHPVSPIVSLNKTNLFEVYLCANWYAKQINSQSLNAILFINSILDCTSTKSHVE